MLGVAYILFFWIYFLISRAVVRETENWAKRENRNRKLWVGLAAFAMYNIVFWDLIPVYAMHAYQCSTKGGFKIFKTLEEWKSENPGVADTLTSSQQSPSIQLGNTTRYQLNQRFAWDVSRKTIWYILRKKEERIIDTKTGEVLAEYIDFDTDLPNPMVARSSRLRDFKMWMKIDACEWDERSRIEIGKFQSQFEKL